MRILMIAVGRSRDAELAVMIERYRRRLPWPLELREIEPKVDDPARRREEAGRLVLEALPTDDRIVVALDEHGQELTSAGLATRIGQWRDQGRRHLVLLIGGADGHAASVLERADLVLAFGRLTWPHELVRLLLVEQLYRAHTILAGHPYHRS